MLKVTVFQFTVGLFCTILVFFYVCNRIAGYLKRLGTRDQNRKPTRSVNEKNYETKTP